MLPCLLAAAHWRVVHVPNNEMLACCALSVGVMPARESIYMMRTMHTLLRSVWCYAHAQVYGAAFAKAAAAGGAQRAALATATATAFCQGASTAQAYAEAFSYALSIDQASGCVALSEAFATAQAQCGITPGTLFGAGSLATAEAQAVSQVLNTCQLPLLPFQLGG